MSDRNKRQRPNTSSDSYPALSSSAATLKALWGSNKENHKLPNNIVVDGNSVVKNVRDDHSGEAPYPSSLTVGGKKHRKSRKTRKTKKSKKSKKSKKTKRKTRKTRKTKRSKH